MTKKEHICARMVKVIEDTKNSVRSFETKAANQGVKVSGGYLRKAAKNNTNIGIDIIDYFLDQFPDINPAWLLKGIGNVKNHTSATKDDYKDKYLKCLEEKDRLRDEVDRINNETKKNASVSTTKS